ncbi:MAG: radical SAM family heme chaperone HemW [Candidatus Dadabacteria bacterium]|nr:radical SAM family heme chaperone HemW [Candidatus Dadabacteria bacterium]NIQ13275.1 radical SAM family heme chaperone HemW [Candidatus Dadabacteria bacterium]
MPLGVYFHLPYCITKCPYCDFNSYAIKGEFPEDRYVLALLNEIEIYGPLIEENGIKTIFFGGGTPSLFSSKSVSKILNKLRSYSDISDDVEISLEANPKTIDLKKLKEIKTVGINRVSVGVQSFNQRKLNFYGRINSPKDSEDVLNNIKKAGFDNFNLDLIYGSSKEGLDELKEDLEKAMEFEPAHLSAYCLTIEDGTEFGRLFNEGKLLIPNEEILLEFMVYTSDFLESRGYINYEISNFSKPDFECKHNLVYWKSKDYLGIGAGAHSHINIDSQQIYGRRWSNYRSPKYYMQTLENNKSAVCESRELSSDMSLEERLLMGLRLKEGVCLDNIEKKYDKKLNLDKIDFLIDDDFVEIKNNYIRLSKKGFLFANNLIAQILDSFY